MFYELTVSSVTACNMHLRQNQKQGSSKLFRVLLYDMQLLVILAIVLSAVYGIPSLDVIQKEWTSFKIKHNKNYENKIEEEFRMKFFADKLMKIQVHNEKYKKGLVSYTIGINQFSDLLHHEVLAQLTCFRKIGSNSNCTQQFIPPSHLKLSNDSFDWRDKGAVTPVKDQLQCGSCWAFSAVGAIESHNFLKTGKLVPLSEQNLVDCDTNDNGCFGGLMTSAFTYVLDNGGIDTEKSYPYEGENGNCQFTPDNVGATISGCGEIEPGREDHLKEAVASVGPISVAIDASTIFDYKSGVFDSTDCSSSNLNHGVLAVGYGTSEDGKDYWIVKNSWGTSWGMDGYILMSRNKNNQCGIASEASYPVG